MKAEDKAILLALSDELENLTSQLHNFGVRLRAALNKQQEESSSRTEDLSQGATSEVESHMWQCAKCFETYETLLATSAPNCERCNVPMPYAGKLC